MLTDREFRTNVAVRACKSGPVFLLSTDYYFLFYIIVYRGCFVSVAYIRLSKQSDEQGIPHQHFSPLFRRKAFYSIWLWKESETQSLCGWPKHELCTGATASHHLILTNWCHIILPYYRKGGHIKKRQNQETQVRCQKICFISYDNRKQLYRYLIMTIIFTIIVWTDSFSRHLRAQIILCRTRQHW